MNFKLFKHKGTGNLYYLIQESIDVKGHFIVLKDDRILQPILMIDFTKFDYRVLVPTH